MSNSMNMSININITNDYVVLFFFFFHSLGAFHCLPFSRKVARADLFFIFFFSTFIPYFHLARTKGLRFGNRMNQVQS